jgi:hypothetical protein
VTAILFLPFILNNQSAFFEDTIGYISGTVSHSYPISGNGFSMFLLSVGVLPNALSSYPATLFQVLFGLPALIFAVFFLKKFTTIKAMLMSFSILLLITLFFSRFFQTNYFGKVLEFLILTYFFKEDFAKK